MDVSSEDEVKEFLQHIIMELKVEGNVEEVYCATSPARDRKGFLPMANRKQFDKDDRTMRLSQTWTQRNDTY